MTQTNSADHASPRERNLSATPRFIEYYEAPLSRPQPSPQIGLNKSIIPPRIEHVPHAFDPDASLIGILVVDVVLPHPLHIEKEVMPPRVTVPIAAYH